MIEGLTKNDLDDLGSVLLDCMQGYSRPVERRELQYVKEQRSMNQVFGLTNAEHWSGSKQLIDYLDDLFSEQRSARAKLLRPVSHALRLTFLI
jgi:hypothetical protein